MLNKICKGNRIPLIYSMLVFLFTLFVYLFGPVKWIEKWNFYEIITIFLLISYFASFFCGYLFCTKRCLPSDSKCPWNLSNQKFWFNFLTITIVLNLLFTVLSALLYSNVTNISSLLNKAMQGLTSPGDAYYSKDVSSRAGSIITWVVFLYSPIMYLTNVLSLFFFKKVNIVYKGMIILNFIIEIARWLSVGTNKGLFDIVLLFVTFFIIKLLLYFGNKNEHTYKNKKMIITIFVIVGAAIILFFLFFGNAISARTGGAYDTKEYSSFPYNLVPTGLRFLLDKVDVYLVSGYDNMEKIIENCDFKWTFGIGNSRFLMDVVRKISGIDLTSRTYPYQLELFGIDPLAYWHSAYSWFAGDLSFIGIIPFMFAAGYFLASLTNSIIKNGDPFSLTLFYFMILAITNASCTNYVLAYSNSFMGFFVLFFIWEFRKHKIKFIK